MKWLFVLLILISGCAKPNIDPAFQSYADQWDQLYSKNKVNIDVKFKDLSSQNVIGEWSGIEVFIDPSAWSDLTESGRQQVIFHEFGHAMFNYGHDFYCFSVINGSVSECVMSEGIGFYTYIPRSIMYPWIFGDLYPYTRYNSYYIEQLGSCSTCTDMENGNEKNRKQILNQFRID